MTTRHQCDVCGELIVEEYAARIEVTQTKGWKSQFFHVCGEEKCVFRLRTLFGQLLNWDTAGFTFELED